MITVFTPTYNRLALLQRLYRSLEEQTDRSFEWVIVDDASEDGTEEWVGTITRSAPFTIRYQKNPHGGKHRAVNTGVQMARGEWFFIVDSDDRLPENAIRTVSSWITGIEGDDSLAGVAGMLVDQDGRVVGESPDVPVGAYVECGNLERYRSHLMGDKAEVYRTDIMRRYPFPEYEGEDFITERIVWDRIAHDGYRVRWYNVPVYICEYQEAGLSKTGANSLRGHLKNYRGYLAFVRQSVRIMEPKEAVTVFREYDRTARIRKRRLKRRAGDIGFGIPRYLYYLLFKMPFFYALRIVSGTGRK